jgi:ubiquinone/menaquinone biosynthesis C-methylase UbiE
LDRNDIDQRVKQSVVRSLQGFGERLGYNEKFARLVLENVEDVDSPRILELGAGHGGLSRTLLNQHPTVEVTATDVDPALVEHMAASDLGRHPRTALRVESATAIKASDQSYDLIVFAQSFHHLPPKLAAAAIAEATRVARKFLIVDLRRHSPTAQVLRLPLNFAITMLGQGYPTAHDWWISELRAYSPAALLALARHAGPDIHTQLSKDSIHQYAVMSRTK